MEAACLAETSVSIYETVQCSNLENYNPTIKFTKKISILTSSMKCFGSFGNDTRSQGEGQI
jgi:hypothetical protein